MRSSFGRYAMELRAKRGLSQTEFAKQVGMSLSRISNIEFQRASVSDDVVGVYIATLNCSGSEALELRKRATFSNSVMRGQQDGLKHVPLLALFQQFGDRISPAAAAEIQRILEKETGEHVEALAFSSNQSSQHKKKPGRSRQRPSLSPKQFVDICLRAFDLRQKVAVEMAPVEIGSAIEKLTQFDERLDYRVLEQLPSYVEGAFACIIGEEDGHTILVEEKRFLSASNGVHFARHVIAHEIGHHYLHPDLLESKGTAFFPPQELAKNSCEMIGSERQICQVVDTIVEAEAELFATVFLVPWTAFLKGTALTYLAKDYGEQLDEVKRYAPHFKNPAVINAFKSALWERGERKHVIYSLD